MAGISTVAQDELKANIKAKLEAEFGTSQDVATLLKYANAMSLAISEEMFKHGFWPDSDTYPAP